MKYKIKELFGKQIAVQCNGLAEFDKCRDAGVDRAGIVRSNPKDQNIFIQFDKNGYWSWSNERYDFSSYTEFISFDQIDFEDDFVLPEYWKVALNDENRDVLLKYEQGRNTSWSANGYLFSNYFYDNPVEITFEQFKEHVLKLPKEEVKNEREIIGYVVPFDLFDGIVKSGEIYILRSSLLYARPEKVFAANYEWDLPSEIVEKWEPIYKPEIKLIGLSKSTATIQGDKILINEVEVSKSDLQLILNNLREK